MHKLYLIFLALICLNANSQKIKKVYLDLGGNHSGFESKLGNFPKKNTFNNFNPNLSLGVGIEMGIKGRFSFISFVGWRISGARYIDSISSTKYPYNVINTESMYTNLQQFNIPIMICYSFGKEFQVKPLIGINNSLNYLVYYNNESKSKYYKVPNGYYNMYGVYGIAGLIFEKENLFKKRIGLGLKMTYEQSLKNLVSDSHLDITQRIISASILINYILK